MKKIYLVATIIAIVAGFATYFFAMQIKENSSIKDVQKFDVVVAAKDIGENTILTADMLMVVKLPVTSVTGGSMTSINDVVGYMTTQSITAGEQLLKNEIALVGAESTDSIRRLSYQLEEGHYAYAINIDGNQNIGGFLREGDYFDIYQIATETAETSTRTQLVIENVKVLKLSSYSANISKDTQGVAITNYSQVILDVTREQLITISDAQLTGTLRFALVPYSVGAGIADDVIEDMSEKEIVTNPAGITVPVTEEETVETPEE